MILLDTSALRAALRRQGRTRGDQIGSALQWPLNTGQKVSVPGFVVQELLSGVREEAQFQRMKTILTNALSVITASIGDHLLATDVTNRCRRKGITASPGDALIAAHAIVRRETSFSADHDFKDIAVATTLKLLEP
ncbi:MAG TPA: PIN domain-containing protein [Vicinamibacteria bacterium]|nr:PIN domain-containing protein [Vicinamibacteria bacterium]